MGSLFNKSLVVEILRQIMVACDIVLKRFERILTAEDFLCDEYGLEKLDSICMQLIAIGESLKNLDKITHQELLVKYLSIEWKKVYPVKYFNNGGMHLTTVNTIFRISGCGIGKLTTIYGISISQVHTPDFNNISISKHNEIKSAKYAI